MRSVKEYEEQEEDEEEPAFQKRGPVLTGEAAFVFVTGGDFLQARRHCAPPGTGRAATPPLGHGRRLRNPSSRLGASMRRCGWNSKQRSARTLRS
mmetsp:Transcript_68645/g.191356  ORF Transcript_68645/g.191356 Transcript_68645/m.191356 type:complete len:95 (+) Transcript_68645:1-285(+)